MEGDQNDQGNESSEEGKAKKSNLSSSPQDIPGTGGARSRIPVGSPMSMFPSMLTGKLLL